MSQILLSFFIVTLFLYLFRKHFLTICDVSGIVTVAWNIKMKDLVHHRHLERWASAVMEECRDCYDDSQEGHLSKHRCAVLGAVVCVWAF